MLKEPPLAIICLAANSLAFAGTIYSTPISCAPINVKVPCEARKWDIGAQALFLQPTYSSKDYEFNSQQGFNSIRPRWGWGYRLQGSYHFPNGNDITMTYTHYDKDSDRGGYGGMIPFALAFEPSRLRLQNKFDQANLVVGQQVNVSAWKTIRFYSGLQFGKIRVDTINQFLAVPPVLALRSVSSLQNFRNADFEGVGPVFGIDYTYHLAHGFSLTGNVATSLIYGVSRYVSGFVAGPALIVNAIEKNSVRIVVPSVATKLGLEYKREWVESTLNLEGGFHGINYFNAFETRTLFAQISSSNFGLYGPYLGGTWVGNLI